MLCDANMFCAAIFMMFFINTSKAQIFTKNIRITAQNVST